MSENEHVLSALVRKRSELAGEAVALRARLNQINADLAHIDASILLFDPDYDLSTIRPKRGHGLAVARPGEMSRFVLTVLREAAGPMPTPAIAARLLADRGLDARDRALVRNVTKRVGMTLRHQEQRGMVRSRPGPGPGPGRVALWTVAG